MLFSGVDAIPPEYPPSPGLYSEKVVAFDAAEFDFAAAFRAAFEMPPDADLALAHEMNCSPDAVALCPALQRARVLAGTAVSSSGGRRRISSSVVNQRWKASAAYARFMAVYERFVHEVVAPMIDDPTGKILYQATPTLRVHFPGPRAITRPHCDAEYHHRPCEVNFWVPATPVGGSNSLWSESSPGAGDFHPFSIGAPGEMVRFWGNRCRHFTKANDSRTTRVSFDFRCIPYSLWQHYPAVKCTRNDGGAGCRCGCRFSQKMLTVDKYYKIADISTTPQDELPPPPPVPGTGEGWLEAGGPLAVDERRHLTLGPRGRRVTVLRVGRKLRCIDTFCYHAGGHLGDGDIEDLGDGIKVLVCPDHNYKIALHNGQRVTQVRNACTIPEHLIGKIELAGGAGGWRCEGVVRQRMHNVVEHADGVRVRLNDEEEEMGGGGGDFVESDAFAHCGSAGAAI